MLPGKVKGIGGAMDLVANPEKTKVVVTMVNQIPNLTWLWETNMNPGSRRQKRKPKDPQRYNN
jgi:acyl CoA:acetate/3-ketoacid CoA transferase beta subunit